MNQAIQLDRAEYPLLPSSGVTCGSCSVNIEDVYYAANDTLLCAGCSAKAGGAVVSRGAFGRLGRFTKASLFGSMAAALGAGIYYAVLVGTGYQVGLIAIVVGVLVGKAVNYGSRGRGGWRYQMLAMFLTYLAMATCFVPAAIQGARQASAEEMKKLEQMAAAHGTDGAPSPISLPGQAVTPAAAPADVASSTAASAPADADLDPINNSLLQMVTYAKTTSGLMRLLLALAITMLGILSLPLLVGFESPITLLIIAFGVFEAWKYNKRVHVEVSGPHQIQRHQIQPAPLA